MWLKSANRSERVLFEREFYETVEDLVGGCDLNTFEQLKALINDIFPEVPPQDAITCSSVHRIKGLTLATHHVLYLLKLHMLFFF